MIDLEKPVSFVIVGQTADGKTFRPSDWAERICGVMSPYRPLRSATGHITYSPYVMPGLRGGLRCVHVDSRLNALEPLAWRFMVTFARDNGLRIDLLPTGTTVPVAESPVTVG